MERRRIDALLADRGLAGSRTSAAASVRAGRVRIGRDGRRASKPSQLIAGRRRARWSTRRRATSRAAGSSSSAGSTPSAVEVAGLACLDVGASTGGFTDCLLQRGARAGDRARRGPRAARLAASKRPTRRGPRAGQRARAPTGRPPVRARARDGRRLVHLARQGPSRDPGCLAPGGDIVALVKPQFELGRGRVRGGVVRSAAGASRGGARRGSRGRAARPRGRGFASSGLPGPEGQPGDLHLVRRRRRGARRPRSRDRRGGALSSEVAAPAAVRTAPWSSRTRSRIRPKPRCAAASAAADRASCTLLADPAELDKHGARAPSLEACDEPPRDVDLCLVLGGDGTILQALRTYAGTDVPVFGINFGTVGFLAAAERDELEQRPRACLQRRLPGDGRCPASRPTSRPRGRSRSTTSRCIRKPHGRVAELAYRLGGAGGGHTSAATAWWPPPRPGRPATTSPTRGRSWPGA